jgi:hypothetical protein
MRTGQAGTLSYHPRMYVCLYVCIDALSFVSHSQSIRSDVPGRWSIEAIRDTAKNPGWVELGPSEFLMPGMVDCHIHAPQYSYTGRFKGEEGG